MVDSEEEVGVLDQDFTPFTQSSPSYSVESETDQEERICKIFKKWNARKLPDSAKGGTVSKKSKIEPSIEPASLGAEDCKENVDVKDWSVEDVLQWLERKGFKEECELFKVLQNKHIREE
ncbi:uncharacterized protein LOC113682191 isoform X2 [Pocillopora damicornis]|uniref:uncharacterized protein LOC113682191 isoform X2 n=1 Tax=Pocillopora damicornis TaxID=46731 RepID=UPI000F55361A|nr:uncharacterized protein LOC113682191 isoform X2 [Pocillopora damicornis]